MRTLRRPNRSGGTTNHPTQRSLRPQRRPEEAMTVGIGDEDLRKMTAAILEKLKLPTIPPSVTILNALKQIRDRALTLKG